MTTRSSSGNSFDGRIKEFLGLGVDKFNTDCDVYLLTHCHEDHLVGLKSQSFSSRIFCSSTTRDMMRLKPEYKSIVPYLTSIIDLVMIQLKGREINVAIIPAYHCPGASMFLIRDNNCAVLVTGDIRAERWWVESLRKNQWLFPYTTGLKTLDNIYLDTTFGYRGEPFIEMLKNSEGIEVAIQLLGAYPLEDEDIEFHFVDSVLGFEEAWAQITDFFSGSLTVGKDLKKRMMSLCSNNEVSYSRILDTSMKRPGTPRFYSVVKTHKPPLFPVKIKQCIDFNVVDFSGVFLPMSLDSILPKECLLLREIGRTRQGNTIYQFRDRRWILPVNSSELLPGEIKLVFSRHSSYSESRDFVSLFNPVQVYPCVSSKEAWFNGFTMSRMFGDICKNDGDGQFDFDLIMFKQWGHPSSFLIDRPVKTINRWDLTECQNELEFVTEILRYPGGLETFKFRGQHQVSAFKKFHSADDRNLQIGRAKDMLLQNIIAGRGEAKYKRVIENHQRQYSDLSRYSPARCPRGYEDDSDFEESEEFSYDIESHSEKPSQSQENDENDDLNGNVVKNLVEDKVISEQNRGSSLNSQIDKYCKVHHTVSFKQVEGESADKLDDNSNPAKSRVVRDSADSSDSSDTKRNPDKSRVIRDSSDSSDTKRNSAKSQVISDSADSSDTKRNSAKSLTIGPFKNPKSELSSKSRPTLKRKSLGRMQNIHKIIRIRSSFDSQEVSFSRLRDSSLTSEKLFKNPNWQTTSLSNIARDSCTTIDHKYIESISKFLKKDPSSWFSMNVKSAHISRTPSFS